MSVQLLKFIKILQYRTETATVEWLFDMETKTAYARFSDKTDKAKCVFVREGQNICLFLWAFKKHSSMHGSQKKPEFQITKNI